MADMDFLDGGSTEIVSTVNQKSKVEYDTKAAHIEQEFTAPFDAPYVQRAVECAKRSGFSIVATLKEALEARNDGHKVLSYHEADCLLRHEMATGSAIFTLTALMKFGAFLNEDDDKFTGGVFILRARFNKGVAWLNDTSKQREAYILEDGKARLADIIKQLDELFVPVHAEELETGIHQEFLKPEHLTWRQFNLTMQKLPFTQTMSERQTPVIKW